MNTGRPLGHPQAKEAGRWNLLLILLAGAVIIAGVLTVADTLRGRTTLTVQIGNQQATSIDLNQSIAISPNLMGSNVFPRTGTNSRDQAKSGFMSYDRQVIQGLNSANIKLLRFPGGNWGEIHIPSTEQLNDFSDLLNQVKAEGMMQVPLSDPLDVQPVPLQIRASRAALLVDYMNNRQSIQRTNPKAAFHPIQYWSIGNEPDLLTNPDTDKKYTVEEYTNAFITYSLAMHQRNPNIQIFGPEISQYSTITGPKDARGKLWMEDFLTGISTYERTHSLPFHVLDGVSFHSYPFGNKRADPKALLNNAAQWSQTVPTLHQFIRQQFSRDLPIAITEINTNSEKVVPPQNMAAVWWADTLGKLMSNQVNFVSFFSTEGVNLPYPLLTQNLNATAMLRVMQLFTHLQPNLVPIQTEQAPISIYATQNLDHTTVSLLLINKSSNSQVASVQTASVLPFSPWQTTKVTLSAYSMMVLILHRNTSNEAFSFSNTGNAQQGIADIQQVACGNNTDSTSVC